MEYILKNLNTKGQSTVEYILLIFVVSSIAYTFLNSDKFHEYFGKDSSILAAQVKLIEFSYQHGGTGSDRNEDSNSRHQSFHFEGSKSRFFISKRTYGD